MGLSFVVVFSAAVVTKQLIWPHILSAAVTHSYWLEFAFSCFGVVKRRYYAGLFLFECQFALVHDVSIAG